jgi:hypothetical protein
MPRRNAILLVAALLVVFGVWRLLNAVPLLLSGEAYSFVPLVLFVQGGLAVLAAAALFFTHASAPLLVVLLGVAVAITSLLEVFVWDVVAPLAGFLVAVVAILSAVLFARYASGKP